jgi:superkiller protein 3
VTESSEYLNDSAVVLAAQGHHAEAIACLERAARLDPAHGVIWFNLALSYRATGKLAEALSCLERANELSPADSDVLDTLGVVQHEVGEDAGAEASYHAALEVAPENGRIWNNLGVLRFSQGRFEDARHAFEKAVALIPDFEDALFNLRDAYDELGDERSRDICAESLRALERRREGGADEVKPS